MFHLCSYCPRLFSARILYVSLSLYMQAMYFLSNRAGCIITVTRTCYLVPIKCLRSVRREGDLLQLGAKRFFFPFSSPRLSFSFVHPRDCLIWNLARRSFSCSTLGNEKWFPSSPPTDDYERSRAEAHLC